MLQGLLESGARTSLMTLTARKRFSTANRHPIRILAVNPTAANGLEICTNGIVENVALALLNYHLKAVLIDELVGKVLFRD